MDPLVHVELAKLFIREVVRSLVLASSMTNNVSGNFVDNAFFKAKLFPLLSVKASTSTFRFFSLPWPRIFTAINVAKSLSLSKDSGSPIYKSSITPTRKTSLCLLEGLKVGIPTLRDNLNWMVACLFLALLDKLSHDALRSSSKASFWTKAQPFSPFITLKHPFSNSPHPRSGYFSLALHLPGEHLLLHHLPAPSPEHYSSRM